VVTYFWYVKCTAGTTLTRTLDHPTAAVSMVRPRHDQVSARKSTSQPTTDSNATSHVYRLFKMLLNELTDLAQTRLLCIIRNKTRLVEALPRAVNRHRAHSATTPTHTHGATKKEAATYTHRTSTTRVPESTAITGNGGAAG